MLHQCLDELDTIEHNHNDSNSHALHQHPNPTNTNNNNNKLKYYMATSGMMSREHALAEQNNHYHLDVTENSNCPRKTKYLFIASYRIQFNKHHHYHDISYRLKLARFWMNDIRMEIENFINFLHSHHTHTHQQFIQHLTYHFAFPCGLLMQKFKSLALSL